MNICVLGWYGTETIGDRAILAGLIHFFNETFASYELQLGSLNPFFSRRTFIEDQHLYGSQAQLSLFDSTDSKQLDFAIQKADWDWDGVPGVCRV